MLQRIQTIYLLAIIIICAVLCGGSVVNMHQFVNGNNYDYVMNFMYFKVYENGTLVENDLQYVLLLLVSLTIAWTIKIIFGFKNRTKQIKHAKINFIFLGILFASLFSTAAIYIPGFNFSTLTSNSVFGIALFIFMFYLNFRVIMLIRRDDNMVKSADRIR